MRLIKFSKILILFICFLAMGGCVNISEHIYNANYYKPYNGTCRLYNALTEVFYPRPELHSGSGSEAMISHAYAVIWSPWIIVDFPCEIVFDTLTLPFDALSLP